MTSIKEIDSLKAMCATWERVREDMQEAAAPFEAAAHEIIKTRSGGTEGYTRMGQYPQFREIYEDGCLFHVSNGRDYNDDFNVSISFETLGSAPLPMRSATL